MFIPFVRSSELVQDAVEFKHKIDCHVYCVLHRVGKIRKMNLEKGDKKEREKKKMCLVIAAPKKKKKKKNWSGSQTDKNKKECLLADSND